MLLENYGNNNGEQLDTARINRIQPVDRSPAAREARLVSMSNYLARSCQQPVVAAAPPPDTDDTALATIMEPSGEAAAHTLAAVCTSSPGYETPWPQYEPDDAEPVTVEVDLNEVARTLRLFVRPGGIGEVRIIQPSGSTSGFFFRFDQIAEAAELVSQLEGSAKGIYVVMNEISPTVLAGRVCCTVLFGGLTKNADT